jgi:outer membrane lipoprotein LolB
VKLDAAPAARAALVAIACALAIAVLPGCATQPPASTTETVAVTEDVAFDIAGRLSARRGSEAAAASFRWQHRIDRDELLLSTPLGQALARLEGRASEVRLELPDGRVAQASDWDELTTRAIGAPIPVRGLAWWVRGVPHPGSAHTVERDAGSRVSVLRQDGWEIVYGYANADPRPSRLRLAYPDTEIRLVIDEWTSPGA